MGLCRLTCAFNSEQRAVKYLQARQSSLYACRINCKRLLTESTAGDVPEGQLCICSEGSFWMYETCACTCVLFCFPKRNRSQQLFHSCDGYYLSPTAIVLAHHLVIHHQAGAFQLLANQNKYRKGDQVVLMFPWECCLEQIRTFPQKVYLKNGTINKHNRNYIMDPLDIITFIRKQVPTGEP